MCCATDNIPKDFPHSDWIMDMNTVMLAMDKSERKPPEVGKGESKVLQKKKAAVNTRP